MSHYSGASLIMSNKEVTFYHIIMELIIITKVACHKCVSKIMM